MRWRIAKPFLNTLQQITQQRLLLLMSFLSSRPPGCFYILSWAGQDVLPALESGFFIATMSAFTI